MINTPLRNIFITFLLAVTSSQLFAKNDVVYLPYLNVTEFKQELSVVVDKDYHYGLIDTQGKELIKPQYDFMRIDDNGAIYVEKQIGDEYKNWFIDQTGEKVDPKQFDSVEKSVEEPQVEKENTPNLYVKYQWLMSKYSQVFFHRNNVILVRRGRLWGILDLQGNEILPPKYFVMQSSLLSDNLLIVAGSEEFFGGYGYIDLQGKEVVPQKYHFPNEVKGLARLTEQVEDRLQRLINSKGKSIFINDKLQQVLPPDSYNYLLFEQDGIIFVKKGAFEGAINTKGEVLIPAEFDDIKRNKQGFYIGITSDKKLALFSPKGKQLSQPIYVEIEALPLAPYFMVRDNYKLNLMDYSGKVLDLDYCAYDDKSIENAIIVVGCDEQKGIVDEAGKELVKPQYKDVQIINKQLFIVENEQGLKGFVNRQGQHTTDIIYEEISPFSNGLAKVYTPNDQWGFVNMQGNVVIAKQIDKNR
ncbi:WG repeat-containing protein [Pasteurella atlantica]|uniref:WG repeat-containing protein n=1 Tax=Pasteurellaceae TaxID=712 RepID=UPI00274F2783|nr:WG repeat-containing protein [Pasteurella atlantica]MDP8098849.1 WG repeat-containing protein [Pasteurella atlantica]MDP8106232.1 WG repeat-containing protein [Pasteurella atlantica]MDP8115961.1 WG repeat-containing protein [Pasteurella atlantica]